MSHLRISLRELFLITAAFACLFGYWFQYRKARETSVRAVAMRSEFERRERDLNRDFIGAMGVLRWQLDRAKAEHVRSGIAALGLEFSAAPVGLDSPIYGDTLHVDAQASIDLEKLQRVLQYQFPLAGLECSGRWDEQSEPLLKSLSNLEPSVLILRDEHATDADVTRLATAFPKASGFALRSHQAENPCAAILAALPDLTYLELGPQADDADFPPIAKLESLNALFVDGAPVSHVGFAHLAGLRSIRSIHLRNLPAVDAALCRELTRLPYLAHLRVSGVSISPDALPWLAKCPRLTRLNLSAEGLHPDHLAVLSQAPWLLHLDLFQCSFTYAEKSQLHSLLDTVEVIYHR